MAKKTELPHVLVLDPNGTESRITHPGALINAVYGGGYTLKDSKLTVDAALAQLAEGLDEDGQLPITAPEAPPAPATPSTPAAATPPSSK